MKVLERKYKMLMI